MRRTLRAVESDWDLRQTWGWDYPLAAMTAARLNEPEKAVDWLFYDAKNNKFGVSGMTPRVHLDEHAQAFVPKAGEGGEVGFEYRMRKLLTDVSDEWQETVFEARQSAGEFSGQSGELLAGTTYEFRAVARHRAITVYGDSVAFRTG